VRSAGGEATPNANRSRAVCSWVWYRPRTSGCWRVPSATLARRARRRATPRCAIPGRTAACRAPALWSGARGSVEVAGVLEPAFRVLRRYLVESPVHGVEHAHDSPLSRCAEGLLDLAAALFHGREVRRVRRQRVVLGAGCLDGRTDLGVQVRLESISEHDVAGPQHGSQILPRVRLEAKTIHGALEDHRCHHPLQVESEHQREVRVRIRRRLAVGSLPAGGVAVEPGHAQVGAELVDEDQAARICCRRPALKVRAGLLNVRAVLFAGTQRPFFRVISIRSSVRLIVERLTCT
jgi:hypothetical protein